MKWTKWLAYGIWLLERKVRIGVKPLPGAAISDPLYSSLGGEPRMRIFDGGGYGIVKRRALPILLG